mmetsp:Transcript_75049/g.172004  ORF Transcript_75049/g.172004 Transcript_75049/m.172004 type:complete len:344 (+) Transcript_75049:56-1087(+)
MGVVNAYVVLTSAWRSLDRRQIQRAALSSCSLVSADHVPEVEFQWGFFMGDPPEDPRQREQAAEELITNDDLIVVGGHDLDPPVAQDVTYVLPRPTARAYRVAFATRWLYHHHDPDFVFYLDDDAFLSLPRLAMLLLGVMTHHSEGLDSAVVGFTMQTALDWSAMDMDVCDMCGDNCIQCVSDLDLRAWCKKVAPGMGLAGCLLAMKNCKIMGGEEGMSTAECVEYTVKKNNEVSEYFGSKWAPTWVLGMGWGFGRRVIRHVAQNAGQLKLRGAADVILGFWLAGLEDLDWVDVGTLGGRRFHDHPGGTSMFAAECTDASILIHRLNEARWRGFDNQTCKMTC